MNHSWCLPVVASETFYANLNPLNLNLRDLLSFQSHATSSKLLEHAGDIFSLLTNQVHIKLGLTQTAQLSIFPAVLHLFEGPTWEIEMDKREQREKKLSDRYDSDLWPLDHEAILDHCATAARLIILLQWLSLDKIFFDTDGFSILLCRQLQVNYEVDFKPLWSS